MLKIKLANLVFRFSLIPVLAFLVLLPVLISLGLWQLNRAEEKKLILAELAQRQRLPHLRLKDDAMLASEALRFRKVVVSGIYDSAHQFLLDNQIVAGKAGYFILTPLIIEASKKAVLVNRGWLAADSDRTKLPDISLQTANTVILGRINHFPGVALRLKDAEKPTEGWPAVVQLVNAKVLGKKLGYELLDFQVQLDSDQADGYHRKWQNVVAMSPEKHSAYAMQWFGLALTLTVLFFYYSCKKVSDE